MNPHALRARVKTLELFGSVQSGLSQVEAAIEQALDTDDAALAEVSTHLLRAGGKRIRPALVLLAAQFPGSDLQRVIPAAVAVELIHMATLVHDDVVDEAATRRGRPTVNAKWSNQVSVLTGDYLFAKAFSILADTGNNQMVRICADLVFAMSRGELKQAASYFDSNQTEADYMERIAQKTAYFIADSCRLGALVGGGSAADQQVLYNYGLWLGFSFQIADDLLDFTGSAAAVGKPVCSDLRIGILTLPVLHCLSTARGDEVRSVIARRAAMTEADVRRVGELLHETGSLVYARAKADWYLARACEELKKAPTLESRETLLTLADFVVNRQF